MNIMVYGIGNGRTHIERQLKKGHEIIGYTDSFFRGDKFNGKRYFKVEELVKVEFDVIVIAVSRLIDSIKIYNKLIENKIDKNKIVNYYSIYYGEWRKKIKDINSPINFTDVIIKNNKCDVDGVVLGISYAERGIDSKELKGNAVNLSYGSQDLYYNLKVLKKVILDKKFKHLKYAIIDMWNYNYFNYDLSRTQNAIRYYLSTGFDNEDIHNFRLNKYFTNDIKEQIEKLDICKVKIELFHELFETNLCNEGNSDGFQEICKSINDTEIKEYENNNGYSRGSIEIKRFEDTIKENIVIFNEILGLLTSINKEIKIYVVLLPEYKIVEDTEKVTFKVWKKEFYEILNGFKHKYKIEILDFKNLEEISSKKEYYYDLYHLNNCGAKKFTQLLNRYIDII